VRATITVEGQEELFCETTEIFSVVDHVADFKFLVKRFPKKFAILESFLANILESRIVTVDKLLSVISELFVYAPQFPDSLPREDVLSAGDFLADRATEFWGNFGNPFPEQLSELSKIFRIWSSSFPPDCNDPRLEFFVRSLHNCFEITRKGFVGWELNSRTTKNPVQYFPEFRSSFPGLILRNLSFLGSNTFSEVDLEFILENLPELRSLAIAECPLLTPKILKIISQHPKLGKLHLSDFSWRILDFSDFSESPGLVAPVKTLSLQNFPKLITVSNLPGLDFLGFLNCPSLTSISISKKVKNFMLAGSPLIHSQRVIEQIFGEKEFHMLDSVTEFSPLDFSENFFAVGNLIRLPDLKSDVLRFLVDCASFGFLPAAKTLENFSGFHEEAVSEILGKCYFGNILNLSSERVLPFVKEFLGWAKKYPSGILPPGYSMYDSVESELIPGFLAKIESPAEIILATCFLQPFDLDEDGVKLIWNCFRNFEEKLKVVESPLGKFELQTLCFGLGQWKTFSVPEEFKKQFQEHLVNFVDMLFLKKIFASVQEEFWFRDTFKNLDWISEKVKSELPKQQGGGGRRTFKVVMLGDTSSKKGRIALKFCRPDAGEDVVIGYGDLKKKIYINMCS
jgi:hypothetical protein